MFRQLVTPPGPPFPGQTTTPSAQSQQNVNSLFAYHPLQIAALVETVWRNRYNSSQSPFVPWPPEITNPILNPTPVSDGFIPGYTWPGGVQQAPTQPLTIPSPVSIAYTPPWAQPGIATTLNAPKATNWDHLIWAYVVENTRIFDIFSKVLETYMFSEELETPSLASQLFLRNLEFLVYGDAMPSMVWTTGGRARKDEVANRLTVYYWMFGLDLSHAHDLVGQHPYTKPAAANREFIPVFEEFGREVWRGIVNAKNFSGPNDADAAAIATLASRLYDMLTTRRLNANLSREEFRAVAVISYLWLAIQFDSPIVQDLRAQASSPDQRLMKIGERVGIKAHSRTKPLLDLADPFSVLMQQIETNLYSDPNGAQLLYALGTPPERNVEAVIDQYYLATGHDLKAYATASAQRASTAAAQRASTPRSLPSPPKPSHGNGHVKKVPAK
jgi:hypothetical protein